MDLRSTKKGLATCITRFRGTRDVCTTFSFKGGIVPGFSEWLCNHWSLARPGFIAPVRRDLHQQKNPFELVRWPRPRRARAVRFSFSPTIRLELLDNSRRNPERVLDDRFNSTMQLACFPGGIASTTFEIAGARVNSSLTLHTKSLEHADAPLLGTIFGSVIKESLRTRSVYSSSSREIATDRASMILERQNSQEFLKRNWQPEMIRLPAIVSNLLANVFRTVRACGRSLNVNVVSLLSPLNMFRSVSDQHQSSTINTTTLTLQSLSQTRVLEHLLSNSPFTGLKGADLWRGANAESRHFTNLSLNFAGPGPSSTEMLTQRITHFVNSPALTYAKHESVLSEKIVNALRDLRSSLSESKPITAQQLPSIEHLTSQVRQQLERDLRIEKERRGL